MTTIPTSVNIENIALKFTPYARAKLQFICDNYEHEVGAMGIAATADPFLVTDLFIPKQKCSDTFVAMDANDLADSMFMVYCDPDGPHKLKPHQVGRIYIHTHPSGCLSPSLHDETIFSESFGNMPWAMMVILPKGGPLYARIRVALGNDFQMQLRIRDEIVITSDFPAASKAEWQKEVDAKITVDTPIILVPASMRSGVPGTYKLPSGYWKKQNKKKQQKQRKSEKEEEEEMLANCVPIPKEEAVSNIPFPQQGPSELDNVPSKYVTKMWEESSLRWVPPCTSERIEYLKEFGFKHSPNPQGYDDNYTLIRDDIMYDFDFKQAWAFVDMEESIDEELDDFECAMFTLTGDRVFGDAIVVGDTLANVYSKVWADCLWMIRNATDSTDALVLTQEEYKLAEKVASGELTADEALMQIPDVVDEKEALDNNGVFIEYCGDSPSAVLTHEEQVILGES